MPRTIASHVAALCVLCAVEVHAQAVQMGSRAVLATLQRVRGSMRSTRYVHTTRIDERAGRYEFDCSGMAAWVLQRSAPRAWASLHNGRPLAIDFYRAIAAAPAGRSRGGWTRIARIADARPGDVLAWPRPRWFPSRNTGHVAFVAEMPVVTPRGVLVRVVDSTSVGHEADTRAAPATGFGSGTLLIATDATGAGTAYGWIGAATPPEWMIATPVRVGRATD